jgi:predicted nucleotidyltransferase
MALFGEMITGTTIRKTVTAIQSALADLPDVYAVYGFGSYFRDERHNDIDLLVIACPGCLDSLALFYEVRKRLYILEGPIDITLLTYGEFLGRPLMEHDSLTEIHKKPWPPDVERENQ